MKKQTIVLLLTLSLFNIGFAAQKISFYSDQCQQLKGQLHPFMLILKRGENVKSALLSCVKDADITGASITGIGALHNVTLAYYDLKNKKYVNKSFNKIDYELLSFIGNIAMHEGQPLLHAHLVLGDHQYHAIGGHFVDGTVAVTGEFFIQPFNSMLTRKLNNDIGLGLISPSH